MKKDSKTYTFTRKQISVLVVAVIAVAVLLVPTGVNAAGSSFVKIRDYASNSTKGKASVKNHRLSVGDGKGPLTVDTKAQPFAADCNGNSTTSSFSCTLQAPAKKTLVIETISVAADVPAGQRGMVIVRVATDGDAHDYYQPMTFQRSFSSNTFDSYVGTAQQTIYADPGSDISAHFYSGSSASGTKFMTTSVAGHLE